MIECSDSSRFAVESFAALSVGSKVPGQHLDRDDSVKAGIPCFVHLAHAAGPNELENLVGAKVDAGHERQSQLLSLCRIIWSNCRGWTPNILGPPGCGGSRNTRALGRDVHMIRVLTLSVLVLIGLSSVVWSQ